jgi:hypothetical protein
MRTPQAEIEQEDTGTSTPDDSNEGAASAPVLDPKHEERLAFLAGEEGSATEGEQGDEPDTAAPAAEGSPDPVEAVRAHLAGDAPEQADTAATAEKKKEPTPAEAVVAKDQAAKGDAPATDPKAIGDEPEGLDEVEKAIRGKSQKAFIELRKQGKQLREQLKAQSDVVEKEREWADHGRGFVGIFKERGGVDDLAAINDDQHVGVVRIQAALNRIAQAQAKGEQPAANDSAMVEEAYARLAPMVKAKPAAAPVTLEPFAGELPAAQRELIDAGLLDEADARLLAAAKAYQAKVKEAPKAPAAVVAPPAAAPAAPAARPAPAPAARSEAPATSDEQRAHAGRVVAFLTERGVPEASIRDHFVAKVQPVIVDQLTETAAKAGTTALDLFYRLSPQSQLSLIQLAQSKVEESAKPPATVPGAGQAPAGRTPRPKAPLFQNALGRGGRRLPTTSGNPHEATQAFLAGESG